ncbi:MAG: hypothetical protein JST54_00980 [Deltaproteobacteria bacterium]|nr:hypothetical protein [Deltaproteobacteria bacterium]
MRLGIALLLLLAGCHPSDWSSTCRRSLFDGGCQVFNVCDEDCPSGSDGIGSSFDAPECAQGPFEGCG